MLGILDHNLTTVTIPLLNPEPSRDLQIAHDDFDSAIFGGKMSTDYKVRAGGLSSILSPGNSLSVSYRSARLLAEKEEGKSSLSTSYRSARLLSQLGESKSPEPSSLVESISEPVQVAVSPVKSQSSLTRQLETPQVSRRFPSPGLSTRDLSPAPQSEQQSSSGHSTPRISTKQLRNQASKSSFASRFGANWLFGALGGRSQPSFPTSSAETVTRHDVSIETNRPASPISRISSPAVPRPVPGAPIITPSTPTPQDKQVTQPLPITTVRAPQPPSEDDAKPPGSVPSRPTPGDSWSRAAVFQKGKSHVSVNPCNPKDNLDVSVGEGRRWQHLQPTAKDQHLIKWKSICAPACLPLTTDFMPTPQEIAELYELNSYDIACYSDQVSFLVRSDAASVNLPLAVMREMASQRLSRE
jgi:hypothetical protein